MAHDIVPIELGLPQGDVVTLWAPQWREDGEEWEAFLGHDEDLYAFPDAARLAAFTRTAQEHDLGDHPAWHVVPNLPAADLNPDEDHQYDLVGVPELLTEPLDTWTVSELAGIVEIARSLADVCDLDAVHEVLDAAAGFSALQQGPMAFNGRDGQRRWDEICRVVADRWDELLDAIDAVVTAPEVDEGAVATAEAELAETSDDSAEAAAATAESDADEEGEEAEPTWWNEIGIDPVRIVTAGAEYYTLRCYLDDEPVFLGRDGLIDVFRSPRALARFLAQAEEVDGTDLARVSTWPQVTEKATAGELEIEVEPANTYVLNGLDADLEAGPSDVDAAQLELAEELLLDAAAWTGDDTVSEELGPSQRLGWLVSFILEPTPNRLPPSAPFDDEVRVWRELVEKFEQKLRSR
ncbi:primosomal protein [Salinifilum ghardaiensis]